METTSTGIHETYLRFAPPEQGNVLLPAADDERAIVPVAWHTRPVSRFSKVDPRNRRKICFGNEGVVRHTYSVQHWRNCRGSYLRRTIAEDGATQRHHTGTRDCAALNSGMGVRNLARCAGCGLIPDADRCARRIWCYSSAPQRTFPRCSAESFPGICLSTWGARGLACHSNRISAA